MLYFFALDLLVMVGNTHRYASTHRVCRTDGHTFQSIKAQCTNILQQVRIVLLLSYMHVLSTRSGYSYTNTYSYVFSCVWQRVLYTEKYLRALVNTANIVEFEWIRQYYVQGSKHRETHLYWEEAMRELVEMWNEMKKKTMLALEVLRDAAGKYKNERTMERAINCLHDIYLITYFVFIVCYSWKVFAFGYCNSSRRW